MAAKAMEIHGVWNAKSLETGNHREVKVYDGVRVVYLRLGDGPNIELSIDQANAFIKHIRGAIRRSSVAVTKEGKQ